MTTPKNLRCFQETMTKRKIRKRYLIMSLLLVVTLVLLMYLKSRATVILKEELFMLMMLETLRSSRIKEFWSLELLIQLRILLPCAGKMVLRKSQSAIDPKQCLMNGLKFLIPSHFLQKLKETLSLLKTDHKLTTILLSWLLVISIISLGWKNPLDCQLQIFHIQMDSTKVYAGIRILNFSISVCKLRLTLYQCLTLSLTMLEMSSLVRFLFPMKVRDRKILTSGLRVKEKLTEL